MFSTRNLKMKGVLEELKKLYVGPFKIEQRIGLQEYKLILSNTCKIHPVFHIPLLKIWNAVNLQ